MPVMLSARYEALAEEIAVYIGSGDVDLALPKLRRVVKRLTGLRPEIVAGREKLRGMLLWSWHNLITLLREKGLYDEAIAVTDDVYRQLDLLQMRSRFIGALEIEKGDVEQGLSRLQKLAEESQEMSSLMALAGAYIYLGRCDEAVETLQRALGLVTENVDAAGLYYHLFNVYRNMGKVEEALDAWNMAVVLDPDLGDVLHLAYRWLIECGEMERAEHYLDREKSELLSLLYRGVMDWQRGDRRAARTKWRQVLKREPHTVVEAEATMEAALRLGEAEPVFEMLAQLAERDIALSEEAMVIVAAAYATKGEWPSTERWLKMARRLIMKDSLPALKISTRWWKLFTQCVSDQEELQRFAGYFETDSPCQRADG